MQMYKSNLSIVVALIIGITAPLSMAQEQPSSSEESLTSSYRSLNISGLRVEDGKVVTASTCQVRENGDAALEKIASNPAITKLVLFPARNGLSADAFEMVSKLPNLKVLKIDGLGEHGSAAIKQISKLTSLEELVIKGGEYSPSDLDQLKRLTHLKKLLLDDRPYISPHRLGELVLSWGPGVVSLEGADARHAKSPGAAMLFLAGRRKAIGYTDAEYDQWRDRFEEMDENHNGMLELDEYVNEKRKPPRIVRRELMRVAGDIKANTMSMRGYIQLRVDSKESHAAFAKIDADESGTISEHELAVVMPKKMRGLAPKLFQRIAVSEHPTEIKQSEFLSRWVQFAYED